MRVIRIAEVPEQIADTPLFTGGRVTRQVLVPAETSKTFNCGIINFDRGTRNKFHTHSDDQVLVITSGIGIVATEHEEREVTVGDIIHISAGEKHWHGAKKESYMSHISIVANKSQTTQLEE